MMKTRRASHRLSTGAALRLVTFSAAAILAAPVLLLAPAIMTGCHKEETATTTDSTHVTAQTADTSHAAAAAPDSSHAAPGVIAGKALDGQKIFYDANYGKIKVACATCHTDGTDKTKDNHIRPGRTLAGVAQRTATWNGEFKGPDLQKTAYGAARCAVAYQHKAKDIASALPQADVDALNAYFDAIRSNPGAVTSNITLNWVTNPPIHEEDPLDTKAASAAAKAILKLPGDPDAGKTVFSRTCDPCHAMKEKKVGPAMTDAMKDVQEATQAVRVGNEGMPFFTKDLLSDQQIADVIAYIQQQLGQ